MNKSELVKSYLEKSEDNFKLYEFLSKQADDNNFIEWQAVSIFYSALCYVKAYFFSLPNFPDNSINSHNEIKALLTMESNSKKLMIYEKYYNFLYMCARDARYKCKKTNNKVIERMLTKYREIKRLLKIT